MYRPQECCDVTSPWKPAKLVVANTSSMSTYPDRNPGMRRGGKVIVTANRSYAKLERFLSMPNVVYRMQKKFRFRCTAAGARILIIMIN